MRTRVFPIRTAVALGLLAVALGTALGAGARSLCRRADDAAAMSAIDARRPRALARIRAAEEARLHAGPMPIERAMDELARRGRMGLPEALLPVPSTDTAPLTGWALAPCPRAQQASLSAPPVP